MSTTQDGYIGAGFNYVVVFAKNTSGVIVGSDTTEPVAGSSTGTSGLRLEGAQTIPVQIPDSEFVDVLGDDAPTVQFDFGESTLPQGVLELASRNLYFEAMAQGTSVYNIGNIEAGVLAPRSYQLADLAMLLGRRAKTWKPGDRGNAKYEMLFLPSVTISPKGNSDWTQRQHSPYRYSISMSKGNLLPWGETFYDSAVGTDASALVPIKANYLYWLDIFKGNGANLTFNLGKTPVTTDTTIVTEAGVQVNGANYTISAAPNRITFSGGNAPANGAITHSWIPVEYNNL